MLPRHFIHWRGLHTQPTIPSAIAAAETAGYNRPNDDQHASTLSFFSADSVFEVALATFAASLMWIMRNIPCAQYIFWAHQHHAISAATPLSTANDSAFIHALMLHLSLKRCSCIRRRARENTHHMTMRVGRRSTSTNTNTSIEADASLLTVKALIKWLIIIGFVEGCVCGDDDGCIVAYASLLVAHDRGHISVGKCIRTQQLASSMNNIDNGTYKLTFLCRLESLHRRRRLQSVLL